MSSADSCHTMRNASEHLSKALCSVSVGRRLKGLGFTVRHVTAAGLQTLSARKSAAPCAHTLPHLRRNTTKAARLKGGAQQVQRGVGSVPVDAPDPGVENETNNQNEETQGSGQLVWHPLARYGHESAHAGVFGVRQDIWCQGLRGAHQGLTKLKTSTAPMATATTATCAWHGHVQEPVRFYYEAGHVLSALSLRYLTGSFTTNRKKSVAAPAAPRGTASWAAPPCPTAPLSTRTPVFLDCNQSCAPGRRRGGRCRGGGS